jgi:hypothetical protein
VKDFCHEDIWNEVMKNPVIQTHRIAMADIMPLFGCIAID